MVELLPGENFMRIHDSFIINLDYVKSFAGSYTFVELAREAGRSCTRFASFLNTGTLFGKG